MPQLDVTRLPLPEKIQLMESLWDSLCREPVTDQTIPGWHETVLEERLARLDAADEEMIPWQEAKQRIRAATTRRE